MSYPENSWCLYKRSDRSANFTHEKHIHKCSVEIFEQIKPVYEAMTKDSDFEKLSHGLTTNHNESFKSKI